MKDLKDLRIEALEQDIDYLKYRIAQLEREVRFNSNLLGRR